MEESSDLFGDLRVLALAAGEIHGRLVQELTAYMKMPVNERMKRHQDDLGQLRSQDLITDSEVASLTAVFDTVHNVNMTDPQIAEQVSKIYQELKDANAGPVALAISGIAANSTQTEAKRAEEEGRADRIGDGPIAAADVAGATFGAIVGVGITIIIKQPEALPAAVGACALTGAVTASVLAATS